MYVCACVYGGGGGWFVLKDLGMLVGDSFRVYQGSMGLRVWVVRCFRRKRYFREGLGVCLLVYLLPPANEVFTPVCDSVHRGVGVCHIACWDTPPWADSPQGRRPTRQTDRHTHPGRYPARQTPPKADTPLADIPWASTPLGRHPPSDTTGYGQKAGSTPLECILVYYWFIFQTDI